jgi:Tol biopolymer transport system component
MYIAFLSDRDGGPRVYVIGANGHGLRMLTPEPGNFTAPRWSSDGTRIAFFRVLRLGRTLITVDLASGRLEETDNEVRLAGPLLLELGIEEEPLAVTLSPDRTRTAFMRYSGTDWGVYVADSTRQNAHWIALVGRFYTEPPIWSPTGTHLAFVAFRNGTSDLYVVNSDGTGSPARLTFSRAIDTFPRWRPVPQSLSELTLQ